MLVGPEGLVAGTIGGGAIEHEVIAVAMGCVARGASELVERHLVHDLAMCCGGTMKVFVDVHTHPQRCFVFGGGHVGRPLAELAARCGFDTWAVDSRAEFARAERYEDSSMLRVLCDDPLGVIEDQRPGEGDFVVVVTHDHGLDEEIVAAVLRSPPRYLGCIGSARKGHMFRQRLEARGISPEAVATMRTPMGLDLGAQTPDEIAVSVVAEMVSVRRARG